MISPPSRGFKIIFIGTRYCRVPFLVLRAVVRCAPRWMRRGGMCAVVGCAPRWDACRSGMCAAVGCVPRLVARRNGMLAAVGCVPRWDACRDVPCRGGNPPTVAFRYRRLEGRCIHKKSRDAASRLLFYYSSSFCPQLSQNISFSLYLAPQLGQKPVAPLRGAPHA